MLFYFRNFHLPSRRWLMCHLNFAVGCLVVISVFQPFKFMKRRGSQTLFFSILPVFHQGLNSTARHRFCFLGESGGLRPACERIPRVPRVPRRACVLPMGRNPAHSVIFHTGRAVAKRCSGIWCTENCSHAACSAARCASPPGCPLPLFQSACVNLRTR